MKEIWKDIPDYEGLYQVSNLGEVRSLDRYETNGKTIVLYKGKMLNKALNHSKKAYYMVSLSKKGNVTKKYVHRLVAETFLDNPYNYKCINHKDENKLNNNVNNLEYCTNEYNVNYGTRNEKVRISKLKSVLQYDLKGNFIKQWIGIKNASEILKINGSDIGECCRNKRKTAGGYIWRFKESEV